MTLFPKRSIARSLLGAAIFVTLLAAGCGDGSSPTAPSGGNLAVRMTDAATDEASQVNVDITGLVVKPHGGAETRISNEIGVVDLLRLRNADMLLAAANVAPGDYDFVRVELDAARSNVVEKATGETRPLQIASGQIDVNGGFTVQTNHQTTILLDFKADASLQHLPTGVWLMTPVIVQANVSTS